MPFRTSYSNMNQSPLTSLQACVALVLSKQLDTQAYLKKEYLLLDHSIYTIRAVANQLVRQRHPQGSKGSEHLKCYPNDLHSRPVMQMDTSHASAKNRQLNEGVGLSISVTTDTLRKIRTKELRVPAYNTVKAQSDALQAFFYWSTGNDSEFLSV